MNDHKCVLRPPGPVAPAGAGRLPAPLHPLPPPQARAEHARPLHQGQPDGGRAMLITRTPLRISLGGGGTDLPVVLPASTAGIVISAAIDKYIYIAVNRTFVDDYFLKYSELERVGTIDEIAAPASSARRCAHTTSSPASRSCRRPTSRRAPASGRRARSPSACSGPSTPSSATTSRRATWPSRPATSRSTCSVEPVGKQDQYIAAFGGVTCFEFHRRRHGRRRAGSACSSATLHDLEEHLLLFFTGYSRSAADDPGGPEDAGPRPSDTAMLDNLRLHQELGRRDPATRSRPASPGSSPT